MLTLRLAPAFLKSVLVLFLDCLKTMSAILASVDGDGELLLLDSVVSTVSTSMIPFSSMVQNRVRC